MPSLHNAIQILSNRGIPVFCTAVFHDMAARVRQKFFGQRYLKRNVNNYEMFLDIFDPGISRSLILFGTREVDHKFIMEKVIKPGMNIYDIGANIGYYVLMEAKALKGQGRILAIEPSPENTELLYRNIALNGYSDSLITYLKGGVSDKPGMASFHLSTQSNLHTFHPKGSAAEHLTGKTIEVETFTIPDLVKRYGAPDLIRMDVEGHEVEIVSGMLEDIERGLYKPMICFEPHISCYTADHDFKPVLSRLFAAGYRTAYLSSNAESGTKRIQSLGYAPACFIKSDGETKAIFENISGEDTIHILTTLGGARTVLLTAD